MTTDNERPDAPDGQEPHLGPTQNAGVADLPDEVDIEMPQEGEEGAEGAPPIPAPAKPVAAAPETPAKPHRPRSDPQRRIDQLTGRLRETETNAERLARENAELLAELEGGKKTTETERQRAERAERVALSHHERATKAELAAAQRDLQIAIEAGDGAKQAEATVRVSGAQAEIGKINDWKAAHPDKPATTPQAEEPKPRAEAKPTPQPQRVTTVDDLAEPAKEWVGANPWFDQQAEPEMYEAAVSYAALLEQRLARAGRQAEINTAPYFERLSAYMRNEFPDYPWDGEGAAADTGDYRVVPALAASTRPPTRNGAVAQRMPQMTRPNAVLPANGQAAPNARPAGNERMRVMMSDDEKEMAVRQWENGAMGNHYKTGKPISNKQEAVEQWAYRKASSARAAQ